MNEFPSAFQFKFSLEYFFGMDGGEVITIIIKEINLERKEDSFNEKKKGFRCEIFG